ncbi:hypothetical protein TNCV_2667731 [Trichonephila clavipes]|nr:hypothetical protein TNCV_2667731 [Trichonephila clavipes]
MVAPPTSTSQFRHGAEEDGNILQSPAIVIQPTKLSDPLVKQARTPCVLGWYLVASGIEPRPSDPESDALTIRLSTVPTFPVKPLNGTPVTIHNSIHYPYVNSSSFEYEFILLFRKTDSKL